MIPRRKKKRASEMRFSLSSLRRKPMSLENPKILIVDDDKELVTLLTDYLSLEGFSVVSAPEGKTGLERLAAESFDLVVLDVMMP